MALDLLSWIYKLMLAGIGKARQLQNYYYLSRNVAIMT